MNLNEELKNQEAFEGDDFAKGDDRLYELLFNELDKESELQIKPEFSSAIIKKLEKRKRKEARGESWLFGFAIAGVLFVALLAATFSKQAIETSPDFLKEGPLAPALAFAGLLILFQFIDKRFLRDHRLRNRLNPE